MKAILLLRTTRNLFVTLTASFVLLAAVTFPAAGQTNTAKKRNTAVIGDVVTP